MDRAKRTVYTQDFALLEPTVEDRDIAKRLGMLRAVCHGQGIALCRALTHAYNPRICYALAKRLPMQRAVHLPRLRWPCRSPRTC